jgi:hypothetical protein
LRRHCYFVVFLCIISLIVPFHIFAQPGGAGTTDKAAGKAGEDAGTAAEAGISAGTIAMGVVAAAVVIGTVAIAGGSTGGTAPAPQTTTVHH